MLSTHRNDIVCKQAVHLDLARVVQTVDSARLTQLVSQLLIHWIVIYPGDSTIQRLNNWGLLFKPWIALSTT